MTGDRATPYRIAVVCLGNICRSPMAAVVLSDRVARAGLSDEVDVVSAGTGGWHVGGPMDERAARLLTSHGYDATRHRARQIDAGWFDECDLILAMDADNHHDVAGMAPDQRSSPGSAELRMFRDFDPAGPGDVPDPYFGGDDGFDEVLSMVERTADAVVADLQQRSSDPARVAGQGGELMARMGTIAQRAEALLGGAVVATTPLAGGDVCSSTRLRLSSGASALVKTRPHAPADFFHVEARGLRWIGEVPEVDVPEVLAVEDDCLILSWVEGARPSVEAAERLGRSLAALHHAGSSAFGVVDAAGDRTEADGYIGTLPMRNRATASWPEFYATQRVLPYLKLARDRESVSAEDAVAIEGVVRRIVELAGPEEPPARLHGDLWSGNLIWGQESRVWLIDPAAHGGHRETDLAMLALFGCPQLPRVLDAYREVTPLADGWEERVALHQLFPLLVHACMFGPRSAGAGGSGDAGGTGYGARAGAAARSLA